MHINECFLRKSWNKNALAEELWASPGDSTADNLAPYHWPGTKGIHTGSTLHITVFIFVCLANKFTINSDFLKQY